MADIGSNIFKGRRMLEEKKLWWVVAFALRGESLVGWVSWKGAVQMLLCGISRRPLSSLKFGTVFKILKKRGQETVVLREEISKENMQQSGGLGI